MEIKKQDNKIIIKGHFEDKVKCAKLTQLCLISNPIIIKDGYAELPYSEDLYKAILSIDDTLLFVGGSFKFLYFDGSTWVSETCTNSSFHFDTDVVTPL